MLPPRTRRDHSPPCPAACPAIIPRHRTAAAAARSLLGSVHLRPRPDFSDVRGALAASTAPRPSAPPGPSLLLPLSGALSVRSRPYLQAALQGDLLSSI